MSECYGDIGCDGADEDMVRVMNCWYMDRSPMGTPDVTWREWLVDHVAVPLFSLVVAAIILCGCFAMVTGAVAISHHLFR